MFSMHFLSFPSVNFSYSSIIATFIPSSLWIHWQQRLTYSLMMWQKFSIWLRSSDCARQIMHKSLILLQNIFVSFTVWYWASLCIYIISAPHFIALLIKRKTWRPKYLISVNFCRYSTFFNQKVHWPLFPQYYSLPYTQSCSILKLGF